MRKIQSRVAYSGLIRRQLRTRLNDASIMTFFSTAQHIARGSRERSRGHMVPVMVGCAVAAGAIGLVAYLLWPTWGAGRHRALRRGCRSSIGATLFNVPTAAIRMKIQRHSGPQERIDLVLRLSLAGAAGRAEACQRRRVVEEAMQPIDRIFLSISAHHDTLAPDGPRAHHLSALPRARRRRPAHDGLTMRAFRDGTPYSGEDLFFANTPESHRALHPRRLHSRGCA